MSTCTRRSSSSSRVLARARAADLAEASQHADRRTGARRFRQHGLAQLARAVEPAESRGRWSRRSRYIPSPSSGVVHLGPLTIHLYGLTLLVAILACVWLTTRPLEAGGRRLRPRHPRHRLGRRVRRRRRAPLPRPHLLERGADAEVAGHLRGLARRPRRLGRDPARDDRRRRSSCAAPGVSGTAFMDAVAPGLLLAQGIGRIGNWWNQELYGKPTEPAVGPEDRHRCTRPAFPTQYLGAAGVPPDVPLRADLGPRRRRSSCSGSTAATRSGRRRCSRSTSRTTASAASSRSCSGSTRRTTSPACGSTPGCRSSSSSARRRASSSGGRCSAAAAPSREGPPKAKPRPQPDPARPKMTVPKGRVR